MDNPILRMLVEKVGNLFSVCIEGERMEVVDKIQQVETGSADRPKTDVKILKMKVVNVLKIMD
jgi:cyclophilin family peptidyl-prolyl cis-trans isomerase